MRTLLNEEHSLKFSKLKPKYSGLKFFQKCLLYAISVISVTINPRKKSQLENREKSSKI